MIGRLHRCIGLDDLAIRSDQNRNTARPRRIRVRRAERDGIGPFFVAQQVAGVSKLTPQITALQSLKSWIRSRNPFPSVVHPGVSALGYHQSRTYLPAKSFNETGLPSWLTIENAGAWLPSPITGIFTSC